MPEAHSKYSASASARWLACPGSMVLSKNAKRTSSKYSREGTAAHELASQVLERNVDATSRIGTRIPVEHETFEVDADMARHVQSYVDTVRSLRDALGATLLVEQKLDYGQYLGSEQAWGTGDAVLITPDEIIVIDLKYGQGEQVEAEDNTQLQLYALGALAKFGDYGDFQTVRVMICQPRSGGTSEWVTTVADLLQFGERAAEAVKRVEAAEASAKHDLEWEAVYLNPGEKQCRWCPAKATCPELRNEVTKTVFMHTAATPEDFADEVVPDKKHIEPADSAWLAATMAKTDLIEIWIKAIRAEVEKRLLAGDEVPGYKLVRGKQGNRAWSDETAAEDLLRKQFRLKIEDAYEMKLISPTAAEKLLAKESPKRWAKCAPLIARSEGKIHVAPLDDKREAISVTAVADEFEAIPASDNPADSNEFA